MYAIALSVLAAIAFFLAVIRIKSPEEIAEDIREDLSG